MPLTFVSEETGGSWAPPLYVSPAFPLSTRTGPGRVCTDGPRAPRTSLPSPPFVEPRLMDRRPSAFAPGTGRRRERQPGSALGAEGPAPLEGQTDWKSSLWSGAIPHTPSTSPANSHPLKLARNGGRPVVFSFCSLLAVAWGHPNYARDPDYICTEMTPVHDAAPQAGTGGFQLTAAQSRTKQGSIDVTLTAAEPFRGYLVQMRDAATNQPLPGKWEGVENTRILCANSKDTVWHGNPLQFAAPAKQTTFTWTPPPAGTLPGNVRGVYAVATAVKSKEVFYLNIVSGQVPLQAQRANGQRNGVRGQNRGQNRGNGFRRNQAPVSQVRQANNGAQVVQG
ncbi:unnamed protein product [Cyprideis torosa]|uniref:Uncharacterized protein n=1 Tax=Cyprideis torosa TaxID=163714 RepID=A0A7R8W034_9CRUS|nr:unnamed protein product [Cyprideis torosa]CAG0879326.1 unnamed protein product [Cyprideis torosa]